jgi:transcriptional regulator with XRE-family HTH domain
MDSPGRRIEQLRKNRNWEQSDLADKLGVAQGTVSNWENGKGAGIKSDDLSKLSKLFAVSTDYILFGKQAPRIETDVPNTIYKDLVEANTEYRLVPKTILDVEYRIVLQSEIEQKQKLYNDVIAAKDKYIHKLESDIEQLQVLKKAQ